jgi:gluconate 2-dehydrogenase gamma chain
MIDRRKFLAILGATVAAADAADACFRPAFAAPPEGASGSMPTGMTERAYTFFTDPEVAFVKAAVARLIPTDELGPGAVEAGVPYFVDQQLSGAYGAGAHFYNQGPFGSETPFQGYQLPLSPAELYRVGIAATDRYCQETYGKQFAALDATRQDDVLRELQGIAGDLDLKDIPGTPFFTRLLTDAMDGFFADPAYGGNKNMIGWKLVGFPGVASNYSDFIGRHNQPYQVEPAAMQTLQEADLSADPHGHSMHRQANAATSRPPTAQRWPDASAEAAYVWSSGQRIFV